MRRSVRWSLAIAAAFAGGFLMLSIPSLESDPPPAPPHGGPFAWNRDQLWDSLEVRYRAARSAGCDVTGPAADRALSRLAGVVARLGEAPAGPDSPSLDTLEAALFASAPLVSACPGRLQEYVRLQELSRAAVKRQSRGWNMALPPARVRVYRALYGSRAAVEEAMLQHPDRIAPLLRGTDEPSTTPSAMVEGVTIHSGDILVSRGGYPTSALIARGNDYPGNFSHVGLVHVDSAGTVSVIEAHIERGVAVATAEEYLRDRKLRLMVLRVRADLPAIVADPMLPHRAAAGMLARARASTIPYDFAMDYTDPGRLFCSEVASSAYHEHGITLWTGLSTISAEGLRRWLGAFGVSHFETQEPSDLEYDPQLVVVAEWRGAASLRQDHIDNAVIDAMLEGAERGDRLGYPWYSLPAGRVLKLWSVAMGWVGRTGPVPAGMSAEAALRNRYFSERERSLAAKVAAAADSAAAADGYMPPYWTLLALARRAMAEDG